MDKIRRERSLHLQVLACAGMDDAKRPGVQCLALEPLEGTFGRAVDRVSQQGMPDGGHVDTDLVGPSCLQLALDVGIIPEAFRTF